MKEEEKSSNIYHTKFWSISFNSFKIVEDIEERCKKRRVKGIKTNEEIDNECLDNANIEKHGLITIIFCALTVEAFINNYAIDNLSKSYLNNYLDKLDLLSKWIIIPKLIMGRQINTDSQAIQLLKKLISLRNKYVHYKTTIKSVSELRWDEDWVTFEHAKTSILAVRELLSELKRIDPNLNIQWIDEAPNDPFA